VFAAVALPFLTFASAIVAASVLIGDQAIVEVPLQVLLG
jgi:hypothetical protein